MKRMWPFAIVLLLWSDCTLSQPAPIGAFPIKTIGVVTVVPAKIHIFRSGLLDTPCDWLDITDAHLDRVVLDSAARALSARYKLVRTKVDPDAVIRTRNTEAFGAFKSFPSIGEQVRQISRHGDQVDAYLLVWSSHSANKCAALRPADIGHGFGFSKNLIGPPHLHTFAEMLLIDAKAVRTLSARELRPAYLRLDNFEWKDTVAAMSPQQRQLINSLLQKMVAAAVYATSTELLAVP